MNAAELTGRDRTHLVELADIDARVHRHAAAPLLQMRRAASDAGFDLVPLSGFRDFDRQLAIWNGKFSGARPVLDAGGEPVDLRTLDPAGRIRLILLWSALPGASRHHWGSDLDLIDAKAVPAGYSVRLTPDEFAPDGPFARLSAWLDANASRYGFFRPYRGLRSAVQAEPWHYSFAPVAEPARRRLTPAVLREALLDAPLLGKDQVLEALADIHARYLSSVDLP